jgi:quercetin dioxygenase-like cupin family protein
MTTDAIFFHDQGIEQTPVEPGQVSRKIRAYGGRLMMVEVYFEKGAHGTAHRHAHEQVTYCLAGEFESFVGSVRRRIRPGDSLYIAPNEEHGTVCIEGGRLLDIFTPQRTDFL